jgi:hypothetical protein
MAECGPTAVISRVEIPQCSSFLPRRELAHPTCERGEKAIALNSQGWQRHVRRAEVARRWACHMINRTGPVSRPSIHNLRACVTPLSSRWAVPFVQKKLLHRRRPSAGANSQLCSAAYRSRRVYRVGDAGNRISQR